MTAPWDRAKETSTGQLRYRVAWDGIGVEFVSDEEMERPAVNELDLNEAPAYASQAWVLGGGTGAVTDDSASPGSSLYEDPAGGQDAYNISDLDAAATSYGTITSSGTTSSIDDGNTLLIELWVRRISGGSAFAQVRIGRGSTLSYSDTFDLHLAEGWVRRAGGTAIEWIHVEPANNHSLDWWRVLVRVQGHDSQARVRVAPAAGLASSWTVGSRTWTEATDDAAVHGTPAADVTAQGSTSVWGLYIRDFTAYPDTRQRVSGLNAEGLAFTENGDDIRGKWEPSGFKVRVLMEAATPLFHTDPTGYTYLDEDEVTDESSAIRVLGTDALEVGQPVYMGTETLLPRGKTGDRLWGLTRGLWSSDNFGAAGPNGQAAQYHYRSSEFVSDDRLHVPELTNAPVVFEGRRVYVYIYAPGDDPQGDGTRVWAGLCSTDPTADGDYWSWTVDPLSRLFAHDLASDITDDFGLAGIYYSNGAPLAVNVLEWGDRNIPTSTTGYVYEASFSLYGHFRSQQEFLDCINSILDLETSSFSGWSTTVRAESWGDGWGLFFETPSVLANVRWISLQVRSTSDGFGPIYGRDIGLAPTNGDPLESAALAASTEYKNIFYQGSPSTDISDGYPDGWAPAAPGSLGTVPRTTYGTRAHAGYGANRYSYESTDGVFDAANLTAGELTFPDDRIYINTPTQLDPERTVIDVDWERPEATGAPTDLDRAKVPFEVLEFDSAKRWVRMRPILPDRAIRTGATRLLATAGNPPTLRALRRYTGAAGGSLADFLQRLLDDRARYLNLGISPDLRPDDFAEGWDTEVRDSAARASLLSQRRYVAGQAIELEEMLEHELRLGGWYAHFSLEGRINLRVIAPPSSVEVVDATINVDQLVSDGFWYRYEPSQLGIFNQVAHSTGYDPVEDEHRGSPWTFRWMPGYSRVPGGRTIEVKPKSIDPARLPEHDTQRALGASRVLATYGERYAILTVQVLLELFDVVRGDVVEVTWSKLPNAQGGLGDTVRARVVGRSWAPDSDGFGTLTLLISRVRIGGYTPGAKCTSISGTSGGTGPFVLGFSLADYFPEGTDATDFLEVGDDIEIFRWGARLAKRVTATISAVGADTITVNTASAWAHAAHGLGWAWGALPATEYATTDNLAEYAFEAGTDSRVDFSDQSVSRFVFAPAGGPGSEARIHEGVVELDPTLYRRADDPLCATRVRDGVINGLLHKADSVAQVHVNWQPVASALSFGTTNPVRYASGIFATMGDRPAGTFYMVHPLSFGTIDLPLHADRPYDLRIRTAWGAADNAYSDPPPTASITARVFVWPESEVRGGEEALSAYFNQAEDFVWETEFDATTVGFAGAWTTGASRGAGAYANKLRLDPSVIARWPLSGGTTEGAGRLRIDPPNDLSGANTAPTRVLRLHVGIAVSSDLDPSGDEPQVIPLLRALHVQGFAAEAS